MGDHRKLPLERGTSEAIVAGLSGNRAENGREHELNRKPYGECQSRGVMTDRYKKNHRR
jgi:hypothetical protein